jgi:hypothetical protein
MLDDSINHPSLRAFQQEVRTEVDAHFEKCDRKKGISLRSFQGRPSTVQRILPFRLSHYQQSTRAGSSVGVEDEEVQTSLDFHSTDDGDGVASTRNLDENVPDQSISSTEEVGTSSNLTSYNQANHEDTGTSLAHMAPTWQTRLTRWLPVGKENE